MVPAAGTYDQKYPKSGSEIAEFALNHYGLSSPTACMSPSFALSQNLLSFVSRLTLAP